MRSYSGLDQLVIFLCGILSTALFGAGFITTYLSPGLPVGWDAAGHHVLSQLYSDSLWPALNGSLNSFFQGMPFPTLYPPLFYLLMGSLYRLCASCDRVMLFKLAVVAGVICIPSLLGLLARSLGLRLWLASLTAFVAAITLCSNLPHAITLSGAITLGLVSQGWGATLLLLLLLGVSSERGGAPLIGILTALSALFFLSSYHIIIVGTVLVVAFSILQPVPGRIYLTLVGLTLGLVIALPWYHGAYLHRATSPAVPDPFEVAWRFIEPLDCVVLLLAALTVATFGIPRRNRLPAFAISMLFALSLFLVEPGLLNLPIGWQHFRIMTALLLFLPILLCGIAEVLLRHRSQRGYTAKLAAMYTILVVGISVARYTPASSDDTKLSASQSASIGRLVEFLATHPTPGHFLGILTQDPDRTDSNPIDLALSHYPALGGARGLWSILRESSFNAIFASALRNLVSTSFEARGIALRRGPESYASLPMRQRFEMLSRWGIDRIIFRTHNKSQLSGVAHLFTVEFQDEFITVGRLLQPPELQTEITEAVFLVGSPINLRSSAGAPDFAALSEYLAFSYLELPAILQFRSCADLASKLPVSPHTIIACLQPEQCCTQMINSFEQLRESVLRNPLHATVFNKAALNWDGIVAAPFRQIQLHSDSTYGQ